MTISQTISEFSSAVNKARADLGEVASKIEMVEAERRAVLAEIPHTDEIVAVLLRGLDRAGTDFKAKFGEYLRDSFVIDQHGTARGAAVVDRGRAVNPLDINRGPRLTKSEGPVAKGIETPFDIGLLAYMLRDRMAEQLAALVAEVLPASQSGVRSDDRAAALHDIDAELATLRSEKARLEDELAAARAAFFPPD